MDISGALKNTNVQAFLRAIRLGEGTSDDDGYRRIVGGGLFDSFAKHPRRPVYLPRYRVWSTAAGAYQIIYPTWIGLVRQYGFVDFSPINQDRAAVALISEKHALDDVVAGNARQAAHLCRDIWASLPDATAGQRVVTAQAFTSEYLRWGGVLAA